MLVKKHFTYLMCARLKKILPDFQICISVPVRNVIQTDNYLFKFNNGNFRTMCEIYSKLTLKTMMSLMSFQCLYS